MLALFKSIKDFLVPPVTFYAAQQNNEAVQTAVLTNQRLSDWMTQQFKDYMNAESTKMTLLFPTNFTVMLDEADYTRCEPALPFVVNEICKRFSETVQEKLTAYPDYIPHAHTWHFKFVPVNNLDVLPPEFDAVRPETGKPSVFMQLYTPTENANVEQAEGRVVGTMRSVGTLRAINSGVDLRAFGKLYQSQKGTFTHPIELAARPVVTPPPAPAPAPAAAVQLPPTADCAPATSPCTVRVPVDDMIKISAQLGKLIDGNGCLRQSIQVAPACQTIEIHGRDTACKPGPATAIIRVDSQEVLNPHVTLQRMPNNRWGYYVHGECTLNEETVKPGRGQITQLPNHSTIMLSGPAQLYISF